MAQSSKKDRRIRLLKRERSYLYRIAQRLEAERNFTRDLLRQSKINEMKLEARREEHRLIVRNFFESRALGEVNADALYDELYPLVKPVEEQAGPEVEIIRPQEGDNASSD